MSQSKFTYSNPLAQLAYRAVVAPIRKYGTLFTISAIVNSVYDPLEQAGLGKEKHDGIFEKFSTIGAAHDWPGIAPFEVEEVVSGICSTVRQEENQT